MMVLFLSILGWNLLRSLGRSDGSDRRATCNLHKKMVIRWGCVDRRSDGYVNFFLMKKNSTVFYGVIAAYLFMVE